MSDSEFGHSSAICNDGHFCIDSWGAGPFLLTVDGKTHRFEDSDRFGPLRVKANGQAAAQPSWPERHPFWRAHWCWWKQGRRVADDGQTCIWKNIPLETSVGFNRRGEKFTLWIDPYDGRMTRSGKPIGRLGPEEFADPPPSPGDHP